MSDWYPDPLGRAELRRHDGVRWTHDISTDGVQSTEPIGFPLPRREPGAEPVAAPPPVAVAAAPPPAPPPGYYPASTASPPRPRATAEPSGSNGLLIAAGVLAIITGAITLILTIRLLALISDVGHLTCGMGLPVCDRVQSGEAVSYMFGIVIIALSALFIAGGISACGGRRWGQSTLIVLGGISVLFYLVILVVGGGIDAIIAMVWFGTITGLALASNRAGY